MLEVQLLSDLTFPLQLKNQQLWDGFAARCEAMALPRRNVPFQFWAMPFVRALPFQVEPSHADCAGGQKTKPGAQPVMRGAFRRGRAIGRRSREHETNHV